MRKGPLPFISPTADELLDRKALARAAPRICDSETTCFDSFGLSLSTSITPVLQHFLIDIISFLHVPHFDVDRSQIEWNLRVKTEMSACIYSYNAKRP